MMGFHLDFPFIRFLSHSVYYYRNKAQSIFYCTAPAFRISGFYVIRIQGHTVAPYKFLSLSLSRRGISRGMGNSIAHD